MTMKQWSVDKAGFVRMGTAFMLAFLAIACGPPPPDIGDDACHAKMNHCSNQCSKSDLGVMCKLCCYNQATKCDDKGDYSFSTCYK